MYKPFPSTGGRAPVGIDWLAADGVLTLSATTVKRGEGYVDRWSVTPSVTLGSETMVDARNADEPRYVSRAHVPERLLAADTTYTFSYSIIMRAGEESWAGSGNVAITIGSECTESMPSDQGACGR